MEWIPVNKKLPTIPKGKYGVKVLMTLHDHVYEEINPGKGSYVTTAIWDGNDFKVLGTCLKDKKFVWMWCGDTPTHWMPLPDPAPVPKIKDMVKELA